jgi:hypothetical protein
MQCAELGVIVGRLLLVLAFLIASQVSAFAAFSLTYEDNRTDTGGVGATVTYNSGGDPSIGAADATRIVAIGISGRTPNLTISSATIGGISATQVSGAGIVESSVMTSDIWYAAVPTGTTATVIVTWSGTPFDTGISTWSIIGSTGAPTTGVNAGAASGPGASANLSLPPYTVPSGGGSFTIYTNRDFGTPSNSWTNATQDFSNPGTRFYMGAHTTTTGSVTVTATDQDPVTQPTTEAVMSAAAFQPSTSPPSSILSLRGVGG